MLKKRLEPKRISKVSSISVVKVGRNAHFNHCIYIRIHIYIHTCIHIYKHTHTCKHTYIHTYIHTHTYTYLHKHTHIQTNRNTCSTYVFTFTHSYIHTNESSPTVRQTNGTSDDPSNQWAVGPMGRWTCQTNGYVGLSGRRPSRLSDHKVVEPTGSQTLARWTNGPSDQRVIRPKDVGLTGHRTNGSSD